MEIHALRGPIRTAAHPQFCKPRNIRGVTAYYKDAKNKGRVKVARDRTTGVTVEQIKARMPRNCMGACIRGGAIEMGVFFARVDTGERRYIGGRPIPITKEYHFSCLPSNAMLLRRFFEDLCWEALLVCGSEDPGSRLLFASVAEWRAFMRTHFPRMRQDWSWQNADDTAFQVGTGYYWCRLDKR